MKKLKLCNIETSEEDDLFKKFIVVEKKKKEELPAKVKFKELLKEEDDFFLDS